MVDYSHIRTILCPDLVEREMHMDLYRWATPHIDMIAPDNYLRDSRGYEAMCAIHARDDNPLFMVETDGDQNMFRTIAEYNTIGYLFTGVERMVDENGAVIPEYQSIADNVQCVASAIPLLLKYQGTGKVHAVIEEIGADSQWIGDLEGYLEGENEKENYLVGFKFIVGHGDVTSILCFKNNGCDHNDNNDY